MSVLDTPRIYFGGEISWDPVTTNNYSKNYNENTCETVFIKGEDVAQFRQSAIDQVPLDGNWNPDGTFRSNYYNTYVSGVDAGTGLQTDDPFTKAPVNFTGMLVDSEPYGALSSQLFFDEMSFGIKGGCRIHGKRSTRFHDRYINFSQNPSNDMIAGTASVMWQTCFPKSEGLVVDAHDSPVLQAIKNRLADDDVLGVMVRWVTYRTVSYDDDSLSNGSDQTKQLADALREKLVGGGFQPNPARSLLVGSVGLWLKGEAVHEASDRTLLTTGTPLTVDSEKTVAGTAFAHVGTDRISLDLSNCIPDASRATEKVNLGDLTLSAADPAPAVAIAEIAKIPYSQYNKTAYQASSGIIDIPLTPETARSLVNMDLRLTSESGDLNLNESALRAVPRQPNLYINQGETVTTEVEVFHRGRRAGPNIKVTMISTAGSSDVTVAKTDENGVARFILTGTSGSVIAYVFLAGDAPDVSIGPLNPLINTYMYVRVLPSDSDLSALEPTWQNVQDHVLGNWQAMAPCMDNWLDLGNPEEVKAYGKIIKKLTDPDNFEAYRYMPVTRDLTVGQRNLLYNFLDSDNDSQSPLSEASKAVNKALDSIELSASMRVPLTPNNS